MNVIEGLLFRIIGTCRISLVIIIVACDDEVEVRLAAFSPYYLLNLNKNTVCLFVLKNLTLLSSW